MRSTDFDNAHQLHREATSRERAEAWDRQIVELAPDAMLVVDREGRIVHANKASEQLFGYLREELIGASIDTLVPLELRDQHARHRGEFFASPRDRIMGTRLDLCAIGKDGWEFPVDIMLRPLNTKEGHFVFAAIRDITESQQMKTALHGHEAELLAAEFIQQRLLPQSPPALKGFDICGVSFPAEHAAGDLFDYLALANGRLGIVVADVSGHGLGPALIMASARAYLRAFSQNGPGISDTVRLTNRALKNEMHAGNYVTLIMVSIAPASRTMEYLNAGHPSGYVLDAAGNVKQTLESEHFPLGVVTDHAFAKSAPVPLATGDLVLLLSDGMLDVGGTDGTGDDAEDALAVVRENRRRPAAEILSCLCQSVRELSGAAKQSDDMTAVVIKVE